MARSAHFCLSHDHVAVTTHGRGVERDMIWKQSPLSVTESHADERESITLKGEQPRAAARIPRL